MEKLLLVACLLVYLGYVAMRLSRRLRLPVVTSFLLLGLVVGPEGLGLVNSSAVESLRIVEPIALGMITFAAGGQLRVVDMRMLSARHFAATGLETILPVVLVATGAWLLTGRAQIALPIAAIAGTTGLATVMSTLRETGANGSYARLMGFATATDNVFAILAFSLLLPLAVAIETGGAVGSLYAERLIAMAASVGIGFVLGLIVSRVIKHVRSSRELSMVVLAHVLLMVGVTYYLGFSVLLAGLTMGASAVNLTHEVRDRNRAFAALGAIEFPVVAIFFLWAGASLHIRALAGVGLLFVVYVVARTVGKLAGPLGLSWKARRADAESRSLVALGMSLLPQAGAAVGLGILARDALPTSGQPILAAVLGAVVIFELVGPVGVRWAANYAGEAQNPGDADPLTLEEALGRLRDRTAKILVVSGTSVSPTVLDAPQILAAKLRADLIVMSVRDERAARILAGRMASVLPGRYRRASDADRTEDRRGASPFPLGERNLDRFFDRVAEHHPDAFFMALSPRSRALLGPAEALAERVHCPVFELPTGRTQGWAEALRGGAEGVDKVVRGWMSIYRTQAKNAPFLRHFAQAIESRKSLVRVSSDD